MGEIVEFCTLPSHQNISYKISGSGLIFYVKTRGGAAIGLSNKPGDHCNYWVYIAREGKTWIRSTDDNDMDGSGSVRYITDLLTQNDYSQFWLLWNNNRISLGVYNDPEPIATKDNIDLDNIKYVTFSGVANTIHWKLMLPPTLQKPLSLEINKGNAQWVAANDQLPDDSFIGGYENEFLYIIRSNHRGSLTPGKFVPSMGVGFIPWGGNAHDKSEFEVLCGYNCVWVPTKYDKIPVEAIEAGYSEGYNSELLFVGRARHDGHIIPGKVQPSHKVCYIPYQGDEVAKSKYEILIHPHSNKHKADKYYRNVDFDFAFNGYSEDEEYASDHDE